ncbi:MAG: sensor histidine kinase [Candidatus Binatia bacterium]
MIAWTDTGRLPSSAPVAPQNQLLWAVRVRWLVVGGFLFLALVAHAVGLFGSIMPSLRAAACGVILNGLNHWCVRQRRHLALVTAVAIPLDHVLITYVVVNTGGAQSPFIMMYVVQVLATAMLVDTRVAALSALFAMLMWLLGISLLSSGHLQAPPLFAVDRGLGLASPTSVYHGMWAAFLLYCLSLLVYLGGYISNRLRTSERDLEDKNQRLQDALASLSAAHKDLSGAYDRLKQAEAHLVQSEKMRSLGQLVAGVAHELSNPISFVSANVEHLRTYVKALAQSLDGYASLPLPADERARLEARRRELQVDRALADLPGLLDDCEEGARRTKRIVSELQTFARGDRHDAWERVDLHRGIDSTLALLTHRLKDHIAVHRDYGELPEVECLPGPLNQVFMNLLANAADAIGLRNGNIWITTRLLPADPAAPGGRTVAIAIRDDGVGMPSDLQTKVFDPFFTTKAVGQGTGLGLSVSYGIVERHGGRLALASVPGAGSTFTVTLPVTQPQAPPPTKG